MDNISDAARWMACARAIESDRPDALFRDPLARQLAGEAGASMTVDAAAQKMRRRQRVM